MTDIRNVRWPEIDAACAPRAQAFACMAAAMIAWAIVIATVLMFWF